MGITHVDNILMILGVSLQMNENEREVVTKEMMRGFNDKANEAGCKVTGGQSVQNPWPMIGGTAISTLPKKDVIFPNNAKPGDLLILTKPLGMQVCSNLGQWFFESQPRWTRCVEELGFTENDLWKIYSMAEKSMSRLNKTAADLMKKYNVGACTDVTGFGIKGHAENLVNAQKLNLKFEINLLPVPPKVDIVNEKIHNYKLNLGYCAETSGGLLICIDRNDAQKYVDEMVNLGEWAWIVGEVFEGDRTVDIIPNFTYAS